MNISEDTKYVVLDRNDMIKLLKGTSTCPWDPNTPVTIHTAGIDRIIIPVVQTAGGFNEEFDWDYRLLDILTIDELWQLYLLKRASEIYQD